MGSVRATSGHLGPNTNQYQPARFFKKIMKEEKSWTMKHLGETDPETSLLSLPFWRQCAGTDQDSKGATSHELLR